jgi:ERCC4-type nuclease
MKIVQDSRETLPYDFARFPDVVCEVGVLETGDYSLPGFTDRIAIERKTVDDLIGCLSQDRERFQKELSRARNFEHFAVVIEASLPPIMAGRYRSRMNSNSVLQSIAAFSIRYGTPFLFCGDRPGGEYMTYSLLSKYAYEITRRYERLCQEGEDKQ